MLYGKLKFIKELKPRITKSLAKAPKGRLVVSKSHGTIQYYQKNEEDHKKTYLEKSNTEQIAALAQKDYDLLMQKEIKKQEKQIQKLIENMPNQEIENVYNNLHEGRRKFVNKHFITKDEMIDEWVNVKYEGKYFSKDAPRYTTEKGEQVRSKSEKIIADKLYAMGVPYRYEYPTYINGLGTVYPDFVILDIKNMEEIYWEHLGRMDDMEYCEKAISKVHIYAKNGIFPGKNLLLTFETKKHPLDINMIEKMVMQLR